MAIDRVAHIGIAVRSIDEARRIYEALGLRVTAVEEVAAEKVRVAFLPCGDSAIELLEPTAADSPIAAFLDKRGPGVHHLCLGSSDLAADDHRLREAGFQLLREQPTRGAEGCWVQFVHPRSTGGVLLELSQPDPDAVPAHAGASGAGERQVSNASPVVPGVAD